MEGKWRAGKHSGRDVAPGEAAAAEEGEEDGEEKEDEEEDEGSV